MNEIKVKTPAKINLVLEVLDKRDDGFHNIQSVMQAVDLFDYLTVKVSQSKGIQIKLSGDSDEIPYDERNIVYKAVVKFLETAKITDKKIDIFIQKNIPVSAGLAGGSSNAAGTFFALNKLFNEPLSESQINDLCASLGSDLNFCLKGGCAICTSRGEKIESINTSDFTVSLVKPKNLGISAKEAYTKFAGMKDKSIPNNTYKFKEKAAKSLLYNSLEKAVLNDYPELLFIKENLPQSLMSGSGPTCFVLDSKIDFIFDENKYIIIQNLKTISYGVSLV